jgi:hypothetical protein
MALLDANDVQALGPLNVEVGARLGVGSNVGMGIDPIGFGVGARAGVSIVGLYGGASVMYYFGTDEGNQSVPPGGHANFIHTVLYGVEGGYGISLAYVTLRAQIGVGNAEVDTNEPRLTSNHFLYLEPGVTGMMAFGEGRWFLGADVTALILLDSFDYGPGYPASTHTSVTAHGQVGIRF